MYVSRRERCGMHVGNDEIGEWVEGSEMFVSREIGGGDV